MLVIIASELQKEGEDMEEDKQPITNKRILAIGLAGVAFIVILAVFLITGDGGEQQEIGQEAEQRSQNDQAKGDKMIGQQGTPPPYQDYGGNPQVTVQTWDVSVTPEETPEEALEYSTRATYPRAYIQQIGKNFEGIKEIEYTKDYALAAEANETDISTFLFNNKTGVFSYASMNGMEISNISGGAQARDKAEAIVQQIFSDATIQAKATYKRATKPGRTYVEFHRDWETVGMPILNPLGLINTGDKESLEELVLGAPSMTQRDTDIIETSDESDGYARATDFNTITVAVSDTEAKVYTTESNMRVLDKRGEPRNLISYQEAVNKLNKSQYSFIYTVPQGEGTPTYDRVYTAGTNKMETGHVTSSVMAYIEHLPDEAQEAITPYYVFKGNGRLQSGYEVTFIAGVNAIATKQSSVFKIREANAQVPGEQIGEEGYTGSSTLQLGTFQPQGTGSSTLNPQDYEHCKPPVSALTNVYSVTSHYSVGQLVMAGPGWDEDRIGEWYAIPESSTVNLTAEAMLGEILSVQQAAFGAQAAESDNEGFRKIKKLFKDIVEHQSELATIGCPIRISGSSPTIFAYGEAGERITIEPTEEITYANPGVSSAWEVTTNGEGSITVEGEEKEYLYYEYEGGEYSKAEEGWVVERGKLNDYAEAMGEELGLTTKETERLIFELSHAAHTMTSESIYVGMIDAGELAEELPLTASVRAERIHFVLSEEIPTTPPSIPVLTPVDRTTPFILELGAASR
jgi:hypothetical protein